MRDLSRVPAVVALPVVAALYIAAGKFGLSLAFVNASASAVWPPTGIALAALLVLGTRAWPGILIGAFVTNITTAGGLGTSAAIAAGNTLEAVFAAALVRRFANGLAAFDRPADTFRFAALAGLVATLVSATLGVTSLCLGGLARWPAFGGVWLTWWLGDVAGALVVAPLLVLWAHPAPAPGPRGRGFEGVLLFATLAAVGLVVFGRISPIADAGYPLEFLCFPVLAWAAFRFSPRIASVNVVLLAWIAIRGTVSGAGPFARDSPNQSLLLLQSFMAVISVMMLAVSAAVTERSRATGALQELSAELERRVEARTAEFVAANAALLREVRERAGAQVLLAMSEARLREAQALAHIGSWEWDVRQDSIWWSDELHEIYGLHGSAPMHYDVYVAAIHPDDRAGVQRTVADALARRDSFTMEHRIVRSDGAERIVRGRGRVVADGAGVPVRMLGTTEDITDSRIAEEQRARLAREQAARREAEEANRLKDQFLAMLSHELRTPLNAISGWVQLLETGRLDADDTRRAIATIARNVDLQSRLISDILELSRMAFRRLDLVLQPTRLVGVVERMMDTLAPEAESRRITLRFVHSGAETVMGDADRLQQVIGNLLSNAFKFTPEGGTVSLTISHTGSQVVMCVEDTGPGIEPEFLPHVFEHFRQSDSSSTRSQGGLGLGLAIVRSLVELHGGAVAAENRSDTSGARFTVTLPRIELPADALATPSASSRALEHAADVLHGIRVLVVEDDPDTRAMLCALLTASGAAVEVAASAAEALDSLNRERPDVVLSDIGMPGMNGHELIGRIRQRPSERGGRVPAIAVTAFAGAEDARQALAAGFDAYLSKPVRATELVARVKEVLGHSSSMLTNPPGSNPART